MKRDGSIELQIMDLSENVGTISCKEMIRIYASYNENPNTLLNEFYKNTIDQYVDEEDGYSVTVHEMNHTTDIIMCAIILHSILKSNNNLRFTHSLANRIDGRVQTVIVDEDFDGSYIHMDNMHVGFKSNFGDERHIPHVEISFDYKKGRTNTDIILGNQVLIANDPTGITREIVIGDILNDEPMNYKRFLKKLDDMYCS